MTEARTVNNVATVTKFITAFMSGCLSCNILLDSSNKDMFMISSINLTVSSSDSLYGKKKRWIRYIKAFFIFTSVSSTDAD